MSISAGTVVGYLDLDASKFKAGLKDAQSTLSEFTNSSNSAGTRFQALGSSLKTVGSAITTAVSLPLLAVGAGAIKTASDFETSMSKVAALSGATGKDLEDLKNKAKEMGATTKFSATESADALGYMALAGWDTQQSISALPGILNLAAASEMGLAEASDMVTDYLSAFGEEANQAGRMADVLAYAQANSNTSTQQLGEAFKNCAVNANSFGLDIEQTTALLGKLGDQGLKGSEAGTALNAVFRDMSSKMKDGAIAIGDTNVKITDANGNFRAMADIVADVEKATDGLSESEKMVALQSTFTADSIKAMGILMNTGSENIRSFTNELYNSEGAASKMAATMQDNLKGSIDNMKSAFEGVMITIGERLIPVFRNLVDGITNLLTWFNNLNPAIQNVIIGVGSFLAVLGPLLLIIGNVIIFITNFGTAIGTLVTFFSAGGAGAGILSAAIAAITGPVGLVIAAITALIAIGVLLYQNWDTVKAKCTEVWNSIKETVTTVWNAIKTSTTEVWNNITSALSKAWDSIKTVTKPAVDFVKDIVSSAWNFISTTTSTIWNSIKGILQSVWDLIKSLIDLKVTAVKLVITTAWDAIKSVTTTVWNAIKSVIQAVWSAISPIVTAGVNAVKSTVTNVFNAVKSVVTTVWNGIKSAISTAWNGIKSVVSTGANAIRSVVSSVFSALTNIMTAPFRTAQSVISGILGSITSSINKVTSAIKKVTSMGKTIENPSINNEQNAINPHNEADYTKVRFNYARAKQTTISDVMATNYSMIEGLKDFAKGVKADTGQTKVNTDNNISISLNIDKFVNERKQDVKELMQEMTFEIKRQRLSFGGVR